MARKYLVYRRHETRDVGTDINHNPVPVGTAVGSGVEIEADDVPQAIRRTIGAASWAAYSVFLSPVTEGVVSRVEVEEEGRWTPVARDGSPAPDAVSYEEPGAGRIPPG